MAVRIGNQRVLLLMLVPGIAMAILFRYLPIYGMTIAFKDFHPMRGLFASEWVGLNHFRDMFQSTDFFRIIRNTVVLNVYHLLFGFPAPILLAIMINEVGRSAVKRTYQSITYLPHFISWVVVGAMVIGFLSPRVGPANQLLRALGADPIPFLLRPRYFRGILVLSAMWKGVGYGSIVFLASIVSINPELYESAHMDGAGLIRRIVSITLPGIRGTIAVILVIRVANFMQVSFEQVYVLYSSAVYEVGDVISTYVYRVGIAGGQFSRTGAIDVFNSIVGLILVVLTNALAKRFLDRGLW